MEKSTVLGRGEDHEYRKKEIGDRKQEMVGERDVNTMKGLGGQLFHKSQQSLFPGKERHFAVISCQTPDAGCPEH